MSYASSFRSVTMIKFIKLVINSRFVFYSEERALNQSHSPCEAKLADIIKLLTTLTSCMLADLDQEVE